MTDNHTKIRLKDDKCSQCGKNIPKNTSLCKYCGYKEPEYTSESNLNMLEWKKVKKKLFRSEQEKKSPKEKIPKHTCSKCNTLIVSNILLQCPICLTEIPLNSSQLEGKKESKLIFTGKRIISEKGLKKDKNNWNIRESIVVFLNSVVIFVILESIILIYYSFFADSISDTIPINSFTGLISPFISMTLGLFPILYIISNKHSFKKFGFTKQKILLLMIIGILSGVFLFFADKFSEFLLFPVIEGFSLISASIVQEKEFILNMELFFKVFFSIAVIIDQVLEEFLFRGVLQNSFSTYFKDKNNGKRKLFTQWKAILSTIGIELAFYLIFTINLYFVLIHLIPSVVISIFYEYSKKNMVGLIFLKASYTIIGIFSFFLLF